MPRFGVVPATEKAAGELVTEADVAAERALATGLAEILPAAVIGEEGAHDDPSLLSGLAAQPRAWVVDPLDGTRHFASGEGPFGIIVALVQDGVTEAGWIHLPRERATAMAWRNGGATLDGARVHIPPVARPLRGGLLTRFFPGTLRSHAESAAGFVRTDDRHHCSARRYVDLVRGEEHFAAYWRTLPWDHAAGVLLTREAGGVASRFSGAPYIAGDVTSTGLLVAAEDATWQELRAGALGPA